MLAQLYGARGSQGVPKAVFQGRDGKNKSGKFIALSNSLKFTALSQFKSDRSTPKSIRGPDGEPNDKKYTSYNKAKELYDQRAKSATEDLMAFLNNLFP